MYKKIFLVGFLLILLVSLTACSCGEDETKLVYDLYNNGDAYMDSCYSKKLSTYYNCVEVQNRYAAFEGRVIPREITNLCE